jgi:signal transduction histidine kinase
MIPDSPHEAAQAAELDRLLSESGRKPRVLLAEDEQDLRDFVRAILEKYFEVVVAADGYEALELARREQPDLVISDAMMPGMSGVDLCRALREDPVLGTTPVVLLTARTGTEATLEGYGAGADDYVLKPFHARVLLARVRAQLKIRALGLRLAGQARLATAGTLAAGVAHEVRNPLNALVNATAVLRADDDARTRQQMLDVVCDAADRIQQILGALDDQVRPADGTEVSLVDVRVGLDATLKLLAHRLEGVAVHRRYGTQRRAIASARELNQVFLNLLDNAIRVTPQNIWIDVADAGAGVRVSIGDDGPGVPQEIAPRIFDPFFTTRAVGEGTGLGLYLSRKLVKERGGELRLRHRSGGGAEFVVEMPGAAS